MIADKTAPKNRRPGGIERLRVLAGSCWTRLLVSASLLAAVATRVDFGHAGARLSGARWAWVVAAVAVLLGSLVLGALRWRLFLKSVGIDTGAAAAVRAHLIGMFSTNFLPSQIGGDVTRAWVAAKPGMRIRSLTSVVLDRITALACLVLAAWLALAGEPGSVPGTLAAALGAATGILALGLFAIGVFARHGGEATAASSRFGSWVREARTAVRACLNRSVLARTILLGLPFQGLVMLAFWLVARSIDIRAPFAVLAVTLPPVFIVSALPISIGGFGVREAGYIVLLGHAGVAATDAALLSVVFGLSFAVATLPGGLTLLAGRRS